LDTSPQLSGIERNLTTYVSKIYTLAMRSIDESKYILPRT